MNKTGIKELAELLVEKYGLDKASANRFVEHMFSVIKDGLQNDKIVKIKDLGTFKLTNIAARKSVNVNTGEPIIIESREKITFTPDSSMRDRVNRPFSQFDTVVVNDNVDFSLIDEEYSQELLAVSEDNAVPEQAQSVAPVHAKKEEMALSESAQPEEAENTLQHVHSVAVSDQEDDKSEKKESDESKSVTDDERVSVESAASSIDIQAEERKMTPLPEEPTTTDRDSVAQQDNTVQRQQTELVYKENKTLQEEIHRQHRFINRMIALVVVLLVLCGGGLAYVYWQMSTRDFRIKNLETMAVSGQGVQPLTPKHVKKVGLVQTGKTDGSKAGASPTTSPVAVPRKDVTARKEKPHDMASHAQQGTQPVVRSEGDGVVKKKDVAAIHEDGSRYADYNKDIRIRTGAYTIVGISHKVTVRAGQTFSGISRSQLGPGMECYVEAVNGGKKEVKVGETVYIPKLKLKKTK